MFPDNYTSVRPYAPGGRLPGGPSAKPPDPLIWLTWVAAATTPMLGSMAEALGRDGKAAEGLSTIDEALI